MTYEPGDEVEYIAAPVFDLMITTGEVGVVTPRRGRMGARRLAAQR